MGLLCVTDFLAVLFGSKILVLDDKLIDLILRNTF